MNLLAGAATAEIMNDERRIAGGLSSSPRAERHRRSAAKVPARDRSRAGDPSSSRWSHRALDHVTLDTEDEFA